MAKASTRRLKVFQAQFGFFDTVVAAPSKAAALRAWGTRQNLFSDGQARLTDDAQATKAALAYPETPLRRAVGSKDPFSLEPVSLPEVPEGPKRARKKIPRAAPPPAPADRSRVDAAENALRKLDEARKREEGSLRRRRDSLDAEMADAQGAYVTGRKVANAALARARADYRKAGGED